jgi:hypothetical protein
MAEGGHVDMVQCYDAGIMTAGPLGFTALTGTLASLLALVPSNLLIKYLGVLFEERHVGLQTDPAYGPAFVRGLYSMDVDMRREVFLGGSDGVTWTDNQKDIAYAWVRAFRDLLCDPAAHRATTKAASTVLRTYLTPTAKTLLAFVLPNPPSAVALRRAAACFLGYAVNNPKGADRLLAASGPDAERMMEIAVHGGAWPATFGQRTPRLRAALNAEVW